ncbi:MAG: uroporphyrinogen decarboxylase family protein [Spirochaetia bacterium]|jgi:uroporphyrinogen-III decarboxylase
MTTLREKFAKRDAEAKSRLKEVFEFRNTRAAVVLYDVNYWTFGELQEEIPEDYYGEDPRVMMEYQLKKIQSHYEYYQDDCYLAFLMPWYGTAVLASGFGHPVVKNYKADPAADISRVQNPDELKSLKLPDPRKDGLMPQVLRTLSYFREHTDLPVGVTDCQGPLTTALSIIGYDKFCYWMYDCPRVVHGLMDLVTEALIEWVKAQKLHAHIPMEAEAYPNGVRLPEGYGGVWISDDDSVIMSTDLYRDFVMPYNSRVLTAFGGGCIHYCGNSNQHIESYLKTKGLTAINNFNLDDLKGAEEMRRALEKKGIVYMAGDFIPTEERLPRYYRDLLEAMGDQKGLIIVPYVVPAVELERGRYNECHRNQFDLGKRVYSLVEGAIASRA